MIKDCFGSVNASESGFDLIKFVIHDQATGDKQVVCLSDLYAYEDSIFIRWRDGMPSAWKDDICIAAPNGIDGSTMNYNKRFWAEPYAEE